MNDSKLKKLQNALVQQRQELFNRMENAKQEFRESPPHRSTTSFFSNEEAVPEEQAYKTKQELIKQDLQLLEAIETALRSIKTDQYGICRMCRKKIPFRRLELVPWTIRCVSCQTIFESPFKSFS